MINSACYGKVVELNFDLHRNLRFDDTNVNFGSARNCTAVPIACSEFAQAAQVYPIVFTRGNDEKVRPVVLSGVLDSGNLFINSSGQWDAAYIPVLVRHYPFVMAEDSPPGELVLCIDDKCPALNFENGELLIDAEGVPQQRVNDELKFLHDFQQEIAQTELLTRQLDELKLLVKLDARFASAGGETFQTSDFLVIDEAKFNVIDDATLPGLFHSGALRLAYLQIASLENMQRLLNRAMSHSAEKQLELSIAQKPLAQDASISLEVDQGKQVLNKPAQGMQKPMLKSKRKEELPSITLAAVEQENQSKQDALKWLADEKNRLAQTHKERYAQRNAKLDEPVTLATIARVKVKIGKLDMPRWAWIFVVIILLVGMVTFWGAAEQKPDSLTKPALDRTSTVSTVAIQPTSETDPFAGAMVRIPLGSFEMGSTNGDADEKPVKHVTISQAFEMGKTEVTQGQWKSVMGSLPEKLRFKNCGDNCPVENISWDDAQKFIIKLNAQSGKQYRLPSEAEWEYACRAGGTQRYCGSDNLDSVAWSGNEKIGKTPHAVATKEPNSWGLYDMSGNVWEWVEDCYHDSYSGVQSSGANTTGNCDMRVLRGGGWSNDADVPRAANRYKRALKDRFDNNGFRLARGLP
jgi:formylglycine-generating enzyme required for sulfatase activity